MFIWSKFSLKITFSSSNLMIWLCDGRTDIHTYIHTGSGSLTSYRTWKEIRDVLFEFHFKFWNTASNGIPVRSLLYRRQTSIRSGCSHWRRYQCVHLYTLIFCHFSTTICCCCFSTSTFGLTTQQQTFLFHFLTGNNFLNLSNLLKHIV